LVRILPSGASVALAEVTGSAILFAAADVSAGSAWMNSLPPTPQNR